MSGDTYTKPMIFHGEKFKKFDDGKLEFDLLPWDALSELVKIMMYGKNKYGRDNWKNFESEEDKIEITSRLKSAMIRHFVEYMKKSDSCDEESSLLHVAHMATNALFLVWYECCVKEEIDPEVLAKRLCGEE